MFDEYKEDGRWQKTYDKWVGQYTSEQQEPPTMTLEEAVELAAADRRRAGRRADLDSSSDHFDEFASGFWVTVRLVAVSFVIAMVRRDAGRGAAHGPVAWLQRLGGVYVETFRNVPLLVLLFISFAGLRRAGVDISAWVAGIASLGLYTAAYVAEALRSGVFAVSKGQIEAALVARLDLPARRCGRSSCRRPSAR